jgi:hypothetical protein
MRFRRVKFVALRVGEQFGSSDADRTLEKCGLRRSQADPAGRQGPCLFEYRDGVKGCSWHGRTVGEAPEYGKVELREDFMTRFKFQK